MFETLLALQPRSTGGKGGQSRESTIAELAHSIEAGLPPQFDLEAAARKYPVSYADSMSTVLLQELLRFNKLTNVIKITLNDLQKVRRSPHSERFAVFATDQHSLSLFLCSCLCTGHSW